MNITLSVDERIAEAAREAARKMGKSLNQAVRDYLEQLAGQERLDAEWQAWEQRCLSPCCLSPCCLSPCCLPPTAPRAPS